MIYFICIVSAICYSHIVEWIFLSKIYVENIYTRSPFPWQHTKRPPYEGIIAPLKITTVMDIIYVILSQS